MKLSNSTTLGELRSSPISFAATYIVLNEDGTSIYCGTSRSVGRRLRNVKHRTRNWSGNCHAATLGRSQEEDSFYHFCSWDENISASGFINRVSWIQKIPGRRKKWLCGIRAIALLSNRSNAASAAKFVDVLNAMPDCEVKRTLLLRRQQAEIYYRNFFLQDNPFGRGDDVTSAMCRVTINGDHRFTCKNECYASPTHPGLDDRSMNHNTPAPLQLSNEEVAARRKLDNRLLAGAKW